MRWLICCGYSLEFILLSTHNYGEMKYPNTQLYNLFLWVLSLNKQIVAYLHNEYGVEVIKLKWCLEVILMKEKSVVNRKYMDYDKRIWYISPMRAAKVQASLRIRAVSPEPSMLTHTSSESRGTFRQKARSLAPLSGWACAVKICHDAMFEDTNSLDGAQMKNWELLFVVNIKKKIIKSEVLLFAKFSWCQTRKFVKAIHNFNVTFMCTLILTLLVLHYKDL